MGQIQVTFGMLQQAVADTGATASNLEGKLGDLKGYLQPIVGEWDGEAKELWHAKQQQWDQAQQEINQMLQQISRALQQAAEDFQGAENANKAVWG
ncbi:MAG: WXG100 family type VII secretion target [Streptosporangiales bacterium]|nr:WXG100 family type VII secretion target [Streptosporangiales bacterium]